MTKLSLRALLAANTILGTLLPAQAQTAPDAGRLLREQQQAAPALPAPAPVFHIEPPANGQRAAPGGPQVQVLAVRFSGQSVLDETTLLTALGPDALAQPLDLAGLQSLAERATQAYREAGYPFARVFLPQQAMQDGVLRLEVVEGRYGLVQATAEALRVQQAAQANLVRLRPGEVIDGAALERAMRLLTDLGLTVQPVLRPGAEHGTGDLLVAVTPQPEVSGEAGLDNHGNRYTGAYRAHASVSATGLLAVGDQLGAQGQVSDEKLLTAALNYSLPLGADGWRANAGLSSTRYELGGSFAAAQASGTARVASAGLSYPLLRSRDANLSLSLQWQHKQLHDEQRSTSTDARKSSQALPLGLSFDRRDDWLGGGVSYGSVSVVSGQLTLDAALRQSDDVSARTAGHFTLARLDLARLQTLPGELTAYTRVSAQWAGKNLDSSERFSLGGAEGVRAFPSGEGAGGAGWLAQLELRGSLGSAAPYVFADAGRTTLNAQPWDASTANRRDLAGAGLGLRMAQQGWNLNASLAWRLQGGQPLADTRQTSPRLWVSAGMRF